PWRRARPRGGVRPSSDDGFFAVAAEYVGQRADDLAHRRVRRHRLHQPGHEVDVGLGGVGTNARQRGIDGGAVAIALHAGAPLQLGLLDLGPDAQNLRLLVAALRRDVHPYDEMATVVELALELVGGRGDLALDPARLDGAEHALEERAVAEPVEVGE